MNRARIDATEAHPHPSKPKLEGWFKKGRHWLYPYRPPLRSWHFWGVQGLVVVIAAIHYFIEAEGFLANLGMLYFVPISIFFVPVVYAALNFGLTGSIATAVWAIIITIPNWIFWHQGLERFGVIFQMLVVITVAVLVGQWVDRETGARKQAEAAGTALRASEIKYRRLFESSPIAILLLDPAGNILEANPAASTLLGMAPETLKSTAVADLVGTIGEQKLLNSPQSNDWQEASLVLKSKDGSEVYLEPTLTRVSDSQGNLAIQVLLRDITEEQHRQAGLKAYAAYVLSAQEEERQRISRELHDETIQALVLLCRQLDSVKSRNVALPSSVVDGLREARKTAEEVVRGLRDFAKILRPPLLDDLGMVISIRRLLVDLTERTKTKSQLKIVGEDRRLLPDTELGIFRIAQEALWNVEQHSRATHVTVTIAFTEDEVRLDVLDNGVGFTVPPVPGDFIASGQLGLIGMQERAELLSGKLEIKSSPKKGTRVTASIPLGESVSEVPSHRLDL